MKEWKIEKGIPLPEKGSSKQASLRATLAKMEVGDSVLSTKAVTSGFLYTDSSKKFATRKVNGGVRVWRIQ